MPSVTRRRFAATARGVSGGSPPARPAGDEAFGTTAEDARTASGVRAGPSRGRSTPDSDVVSPFAPSGDQPAAIARCVELLRDDARKVACLRGATGTGKTFVVAHVVDALTKAKPRPTLVVVPNKTLAAQVARELRAYLPRKRVELFVSHFSLYVPESFSKGRYVEKRSAIDHDLDALRHRATKALVETNEAVVVASVSCLYGLGLPADYVDARLTLAPGVPTPGGRDALGETLEKRLLYSECREGGDFVRSGQWAWASGSSHGQAGARTLVVWPPYERAALEISLDVDGALAGFNKRGSTDDDGNETRSGLRETRLTLWPRQHHITPPERLAAATAAIAREAAERAAELRACGDHIEADRLEQRVGADVGLLNEIGWCPGAEHYSRHLGAREPGAPPVTLLDYLGFPLGGINDGPPRSREWLLVADESHVMLPQLRAMHGGDRSRKQGLVRGGYRLPSALDNRPLRFDEFWARVPKALLVSATPGETEAAWCRAGDFLCDANGDAKGDANANGYGNVSVSATSGSGFRHRIDDSLDSLGMVDMVVRPSGVLDPEVTILPRNEQLPALAAAVRRRAARGEASLVCALTKADCEDLAGYLCAIGGIRADWLHSGLTAKERAVKLQQLQQGEIDCLVGAQLLREGLDIPQVSLVAILDAGVPGFMRSSRSLMQMMGRAARNVRGEALLFADEPHTPAMREAVAEVRRRREKQRRHNERFGVTPRTASQGSASASLSLFEVMASEIAETRDAIDAVSSGRAVVAGDERVTNDDSAAESGDVFAPSEEEVERAMRAWRLKRAGAVADAAAAEAASAEARARAAATAREVGPVWNALAKDFTERQFTEALFSVTDAKKAEGLDRTASPKEKENEGVPAFAGGAEAVLRAAGEAHAHVASLRASVRDLPAKTGVYRWLDADGQVLYVGKAKNLRSRTGGYLSPGILQASPRHRRLLARARAVDAVLTPGGERDALALEARLIQRIKPPLNVLLKHAPRPDAARIVATLDDPVAPRFFVVDAADRRIASRAEKEKRAFAPGAAPQPGARPEGGGGPPPSGGGGGGGSRLAFDGIGGRVSPGTVAAAQSAFDHARGSSLADGADGGFGKNETETRRIKRSGTRFWLRPSRADARRALYDLERALDLRALAFRARHGDAEARERLRENASLAAAALDGGADAEAAAARFETRGDDAAAAAIRAAAAPDASALGALSGLLQEAALAEASGGRALSVDVVAAAAQGKHCVVQIVRVRDGTVAAILAATAELPARLFPSRLDASPDDAEGQRVFARPDARTSRRSELVKNRASVEWLGSFETPHARKEASEETVADDVAVASTTRVDAKEKDDVRVYNNSAEPSTNDETFETFVETETALGEATQRCLESYYALGGGGGSDAPTSDDAYGFGETPDAPDHVYIPHELPDAAGLERILRAFAKDASISSKGVPGSRNAKSAKNVVGGEKETDEKETDAKRRTVGPRRNRGMSRPVLRHGAELPAGLPSALASLARANAAEAARKAADAADAAESLALTLGIPMARSPRAYGGPLVVEGIDISHLAGANTSASVVVFVDGKAAPARHRRYEIRVAPGDDPAAIRAAMEKRIAAAKRAVSGKSAAKVFAGSYELETGARVPGALPDLALIDGGAAQLVAAARACLAAGVEVSNARRSGDAMLSKNESFPPQRPGPPLKSFSVALASLAKGRVSGEESVFVPRAVVDESGAVVDFAADRLVVGPGAAATRGGNRQAADGPGARLLRAVRDESHAVALGAQRQRRRTSLFREMLSARDDEQSVAAG